MLRNQARAEAVMEARGLDGLAAITAINVYYVTGYWNLLLQAGFDASMAALLPRAGRGPATLVCAAFDIRNIVNAAPDVDEIVIYTAPGEDGGTPYAGWPTRDGAALSARQHRWVSETARLTAAPAAHMLDGLVRAIKQAGLARGTIGVDDERLLQWLPAAGLDQARLVPARDAFNEIRLVKTPREIDLLRTSARINEESVMHALTALADGMPWEEVERSYMVHMARRGGEGVYLACGAGGPQTGVARKGEPMMFDGLGRYQRYHGDFGRSAVLGDPGPEVRQRVRALESGWTAAYESIRPGARYSQIAAAVTAAVHKAGFPGQFRPPVVHTLGLQHTDDPTDPWAPPGQKPDRVLEADMVLNVDLPHIEIGWGAIHLEDTVRVTSDGCEPLTSMQTALRVLPA
jgi:Xaa-Pro aminopeptidase